MRTNIKVKCINCGKEFFRLAGRPDSKYCGSRCAINYRYKENQNLGKELTKKAHEVIRGGGGKKEIAKTDDFVGKRVKMANGYIVTRTGKRKRSLEHRVVVEKFYRIKLKKGEVVHHINGIVDDNRIENLCIMKQGHHNKLHRYLKEKICQKQLQR